MKRLLITDAITAGQQQIIVPIAHRLSAIVHADRIYVRENCLWWEQVRSRDWQALYAMCCQQIDERKTRAVTPLIKVRRKMNK